MWDSWVFRTKIVLRLPATQFMFSFFNPASSFDLAMKKTKPKEQNAQGRNGAYNNQGNVVNQKQKKVGWPKSEWDFYRLLFSLVSMCQTT